MCYSDIIQEIYALVDQSYKDYQRKLKELYGKEAHEKIMDALNVEKAEERCIWRILTAGFAEQNGRNAKLNGRITFDY